MSTKTNELILMVESLLSDIKTNSPKNKKVGMFGNLEITTGKKA